MHKKKSLSQKNCPICKNKTTFSVVSSIYLSVWKCSTCGIFFVSDKKQVGSYYAGDYYHDFNLADYIRYYKPFRLKVFKKNWDFIKKTKKSGSALDLGASFGWFLEVAPPGWKVTGLEPSPKVLKITKKRKLNIIIGNEEWLRRTKNRFDLITLWNVIEHLGAPRETLILVKKRLKSDGILAVSFPSRKGLFNRMSYFIYYLSFGKITKPLYTMFQVGNPYPHLFHFAPQDVSSLLRDLGFEIIKQEGQPIVDIANLDNRFKLEKDGIFAKNFIVRIIMLLVYFFSIILNLPDEVVVYARQTEDISNR